MSSDATVGDVRMLVSRHLGGSPVTMWTTYSGDEKLDDTIPVSSLSVKRVYFTRDSDLLQSQYQLERKDDLQTKLNLIQDAFLKTVLVRGMLELNILSPEEQKQLTYLDENREPIYSQNDEKRYSDAVKYISFLMSMVDKYRTQIDASSIKTSVNEMVRIFRENNLIP